MAMLVCMLEDVGPHKAGEVYSFANEKEALELVADGSAVGPWTQKQAIDYRKAKETDAAKPMRVRREEPPKKSAKSEKEEKA